MYSIPLVLLGLGFVILLSFGNTLGFSCFRCSTLRVDEKAECLNASPTQSKPCFEGANVCVAQLLLNRTITTNVIRSCDSRTHLHLRDGCFTDETDLFGKQVECVCSEQNCNGKSADEIEALKRQPRESLVTNEAAMIHPVIFLMLSFHLVFNYCSSQ